MNVGTQLTKSGALLNLTTLEDVVRDFNKRFDYEAGVERSAGHHNPVVDFCKEASSLREAITRACDGRRRDGKVFSEGSCVRTSSKVGLADILTSNQHQIKSAKDFDALYSLIRSLKLWGIGDTTVYNVATCIGAYLGLEPEHLYLHAGPLEGWKRLTGERGRPHRVEWKDVPAPLRVLSPHRLEDLLCEYRDLLHPGMMRRT